MTGNQFCNWSGRFGSSSLPFVAFYSYFQPQHWKIYIVLTWSWCKRCGHFIYWGQMGAFVCILSLICSLFSPPRLPAVTDLYHTVESLLLTVKPHHCSFMCDFMLRWTSYCNVNHTVRFDRWWQSYCRRPRNTCTAVFTWSIKEAKKSFFFFFWHFIWDNKTSCQSKEVLTLLYIITCQYMKLK